jgi:hypothetical protein
MHHVAGPVSGYGLLADPFSGLSTPEFWSITEPVTDESLKFAV